MRSSIIGFCGHKGSGKSTAASALVTAGYRVHSLSSPIKRALEAIGIEPEWLVDSTLKETPLDLLCGRTPRYAMQTLGTEWGRAFFGDDVWLRAWERTMPSGLVVVDDVRFPNEAAFLRARGARIYRIERSGFEGDGHSSERWQKGIHVDGSLVNEGTAEVVFAARVRRLCLVDMLSSS